jgi:hypothetical protein
MYHGTNRTVVLFRDLDFGSRQGELRRYLQADELLAAGRVDVARRKIAGLAWSEYVALEQDATGVLLPPSEAMRSSIIDTRNVVASYCASAAATFHASAELSVCKVLEDQRSNKSLERGREG